MFSIYCVKSAAARWARHSHVKTEEQNCKAVYSYRAYLIVVEKVVKKRERLVLGNC